MKKAPFLILALIPFCAMSQTDWEIVDDHISQEEIESHIRLLASDSLEGREVGTRGISKAVEYLISELKSYGVEPLPEFPNYKQPVPLQKVTPPTDGELVIADDTFKVSKDFFVANGSNVNEQIDYIMLPYGNAEDYDGLDVKGKWVIVRCGNGNSFSVREWLTMIDEKKKLAWEAGARGLIELYQSPQFPWEIILRRRGREGIFLFNPEDEKELRNFPHLWLNNSGSEVSSTLNETTTLSINFSEVKKEEVEAYNIVGRVQGTSKPDEYITYSAHYDHVGFGPPDDKGDSLYNGARDNAVGTTTVLSAAKSIGKYPTMRSGLFVFFTAEERGLLGSQWFVNHSPIPLNQIVFCFNSDNGGYNDTSKATIQGLTRNTAEQDIIKACSDFDIQAIEDPVPQYNLFDRSDNVNFARKGIPDFTFSMGFTEFGEDITNYYHRPGDEAETLDFEYLYRFFKAYTLSARVMGNREERPFWVEGDKYYSLGIERYRK